MVYKRMAMLNIIFMLYLFHKNYKYLGFIMTVINCQDRWMDMAAHKGSNFVYKNLRKRENRLKYLRVILKKK